LLFSPSMPHAAAFFLFFSWSPAWHLVSSSIRKLLFITLLLPLLYALCSGLVLKSERR
jgi:hypothetical protein